MNFEPQKFFIGLIDFFSILMPGAMLAYLGKDWLAARMDKGGFPLDQAEPVLVFLFASYLLGHFIFLLSSRLDDQVYNPVRDWTDWGQISKRLARGDELSPRWKRRMAKSNWLFDKNADTAVMQVQRIKARALRGLEAEEAINAFQWSKARLTKDFHEGLLVVQRFEADSKFFRSFALVLGLLVIFYGFQCNWPAAIGCFVAILPALWRYIDQRFKSTQQAYWFVITLEAMKPEPPSVIPRSNDHALAGCVVYRRTGESPEILLVESGSDRSQWVLPKGHIEPGEYPRETAVREVKEETGHWVRIVRWLIDARLEDDKGSPVVRWFLAELAEEATKWPEEDRQRDWLSLGKAKERATFPETRALIEKVEKILA